MLSTYDLYEIPINTSSYIYLCTNFLLLNLLKRFNINLDLNKSTNRWITTGLTKVAMAAGEFIRICVVQKKLCLTISTLLALMRLLYKVVEMAVINFDLDGLLMSHKNRIVFFVDK